MEVDEAEGGKGKAKAKEPLVDVGLETDKGSFLIGQILGFKFSFYQVRQVGLGQHWREADEFGGSAGHCDKRGDAREALPHDCAAHLERLRQAR